MDALTQDRSDCPAGVSDEKGAIPLEGAVWATTPAGQAKSRMSPASFTFGGIHALLTVFANVGHRYRPISKRGDMPSSLRAFSSN